VNEETPKASTPCRVQTIRKGRLKGTVSSVLLEIPGDKIQTELHGGAKYQKLGKKRVKTWHLEEGQRTLKERNGSLGRQGDRPACMEDYTKAPSGGGCEFDAAQGRTEEYRYGGDHAGGYGCKGVGQWHLLTDLKAFQRRGPRVKEGKEGK